MWKRLSVVCVILVLALAPLAALPPQVLSWLTGGDSAPQAQMESGVNQELILSMEQSIALLETQLTEAQAALNEAKKDSLISMAALAKSEKESQELKLELTRVQSDLELAKQLSPISELSYNNLKSDYDNLLVKYNEKAKESGEYFMEAVEHRQDNWGGLVGGGVVWDPTDGSLAATMDMGVRYKQWALVVGAEYRPSDWKLEVPDISDLSFSTGLQFFLLVFVLS